MERKELVLNKNDLVFVEIYYLHPTKDKLEKFMKKIIKFLELYENSKIIEIKKYTIRPIFIYDDNYILKTNEYKALKNKLKEFPQLFKDYTKAQEIADNMQICYGWPTLSIFNKFVTTNELNNVNFIYI